MLYNINQAGLLLGCLMKQPNLVSQPNYPLKVSDFSPEIFHETIYRAIVRLANSGAGEINAIDIGEVVKDYPARFEIIQDNNYTEFVENMKTFAAVENYSLYYDNVRKFALLRDMKAKGRSIAQFYDELEDENDEESERGLIRLSSVSIQDILNADEQVGLKLRSVYDVKYVRDEMIVGDGIDSLMEEFKNQPSFGSMLCSPLLTQIIHGFSRGNFILRSAPSGTNKTRIAVADLCGLCVDKYWDYDAQDFVDNPNFQGPGLFIHTELDTRREMQPIFLACISGVPSNTITMGRCTPEEELRVKKAAEILYKNNLVLSDMPDFTSASIERKIKECVEVNGAVYGVFDYMMLNGPLSMEYKQNTGVQTREDMALRGLATDIKEYCEKYNIGILSSTQTNGNEKLLDFPDESCISGSRAMRNKVDAGFVMLNAKERQKEIKLVEPFMVRKGFGENRTPPINRITYIYKARFGEYGDQKIKVFHHFDAATMRNIDFFCCDGYNQIVNVPRPVLGDV